MAINTDSGEAVLEREKKATGDISEAMSVLHQPLCSIISGDMLSGPPVVSKKRAHGSSFRLRFFRDIVRNPAKGATRTQRKPNSGVFPPMTDFKEHAAKFLNIDAKEAFVRSLHQPILAHKESMRRLLLAFVLILGTAGVAIGAVSLISNTHPALSLPNEDSAQQALMTMLEPEPAADIADAADLPPLPSILVERSYNVRRGDTVQTIARRFGIWEDTLISANALTSKNQLKPGKVLKVPNMNGIFHTVRKNENLSVIARAYRIDITKIVDANNLESTTLRAGERIFIPNARLSASAKTNFYGDTFIWPARGVISSPFGYRSNPFSGSRTFHSAIDIVMNRGTSVKATRDGTVADTGYNAVFGNYVILRHSGGLQSLYAHLDSILVRKGTRVNQGELVGRSGNTGQSTGPHLHFSLFLNGKAVDPRKYLP